MNTFSLFALSSTMNHRLVSSAPLLYKQIDYFQEQVSIEFEPFVSGSFDPGHITKNLTPQSKLSLLLDQQGSGDINPAWLFLGSSNMNLNYSSYLMFDPSMQMDGLLFHCYNRFKNLFFDLRTSLLQSKTHLRLQEFGGDNGGLKNNDNQIIYNAHDAFAQEAYQFGKIGFPQKLIGFDNIQIMFGVAHHIPAILQGAETEFYGAGFGIIEVPTGAGTRAEWLFEPQVGTNHWAFGIGFDFMALNNVNGFSCVVGGNFRHAIANWETRTFDLTQNGPWSRYLLVEPLATIGQLSLTVGMPAINILTQQALLEGRNQITAYVRLQKNFRESLFELAYNFFYQQAESISRVSPIPQGYGIYALSTAGGTSTASTATLNQNLTEIALLQDFPNPVELTTQDLNLSSGAAGMWISNTVSARLQRIKKYYTYGVGAAVDLAATSQAISAWTIWANLEILFDTVAGSDDDHLIPMYQTVESPDALVYQSMEQEHSVDTNKSYSMLHQPEQADANIDCLHGDNEVDIQQYSVPHEENLLDNVPGMQMSVHDILSISDAAYLLDYLYSYKDPEPSIQTLDQNLLHDLVQSDQADKESEDQTGIIYDEEQMMRLHTLDDQNIVVLLVDQVMNSDDTLGYDVNSLESPTSLEQLLMKDTMNTDLQAVLLDLLPQDSVLQDMIQQEKIADEATIISLLIDEPINQPTFPDVSLEQIMLDHSLLSDSGVSLSNDDAIQVEQFLMQDQRSMAQTVEDKNIISLLKDENTPFQDTVLDYSENSLPVISLDNLMIPHHVFNDVGTFLPDNTITIVGPGIDSIVDADVLRILAQV